MKLTRNEESLLLDFIKENATITTDKQGKPVLDLSEIEGELVPFINNLINDR